jgi:hypothetical protein
MGDEKTQVLLDALQAYSDAENLDLTFNIHDAIALLRALAAHKLHIVTEAEKRVLDNMRALNNPEGSEPCAGCGKRSRITTAGCDHCDYEDK